MLTKRQMTEYFILATLMSTDSHTSDKAYDTCTNFLLPDMFKDDKVRWAYKLVLEMRKKGCTATSECDIFEYLCAENKVPSGKVGVICCWLIEVYIQFCAMNNPVTGIAWTIGDAVDELIRMSDADSWEIIAR
jgi:hypothetical protein